MSFRALQLGSFGGGIVLLLLSFGLCCTLNIMVIYDMLERSWGNFMAVLAIAIEFLFLWMVVIVGREQSWDRFATSQRFLFGLAAISVTVSAIYLILWMSIIKPPIWLIVLTCLYCWGSLFHLFIFCRFLVTVEDPFSRFQTVNDQDL